MDATKLKILKAAGNVLATEGASGFSMRKVAAHAGMSLGNLQYHFPARDSLMDGLFQSYLEEYQRDLQSISAPRSEKESRQMLKELIYEFLKEESSDQDLPVLRSILLLADENRLERNLGEYFSGLYDMIKHALSIITGVEEGHTGLDHAASLILSCVQGYALVKNQIGVSMAQLGDLLHRQVISLLMKQD